MATFKSHRCRAGSPKHIILEATKLIKEVLVIGLIYVVGPETVIDIDYIKVLFSCSGVDNL